MSKYKPGQIITLTMNSTRYVCRVVKAGKNGKTCRYCPFNGNHECFNDLKISGELFICVYHIGNGCYFEIIKIIPS